MSFYFCLILNELCVLENSLPYLEGLVSMYMSRRRYSMLSFGASVFLSVLGTVRFLLFAGLIHPLSQFVDLFF